MPALLAQTKVYAWRKQERTQTTKVRENVRSSTGGHVQEFISILNAMKPLIRKFSDLDLKTVFNF